MIHTFRDRDTAALFHGRRVRRWQSVAAQAERRLQILDSATSLADLAGLPSNRLEVLAGDRRGQHSIRINAQSRICFLWTPEGPADVAIVDYH